MRLFDFHEIHFHGLARSDFDVLSTPPPNMAAHALNQVKQSLNLLTLP